jgi:hypothetical protein
VHHPIGCRPNGAPGEASLDPDDDRAGAAALACGRRVADRRRRLTS